MVAAQEREREHQRREREKGSSQKEEEEEEIIWLVPAATLIPCPVIFYARWLDRGLVAT